MAALNAAIIDNVVGNNVDGVSLVVGYSGGLDSAVLLHLCWQYAQENPAVKVRAIHVNHQLSSCSDQWQSHCEQTASALGVEIDSVNVNVVKGKRGVEAAARDARYEAFQQTVNDDELLLLAHHQNDQAETLLLRLMRGSGPLGLRGMDAVSQRQNLLIHRPLLSVTRDALEAHAKSVGLSWIEDHSNEDLRFDRNFLRHDIVPQLQTRWPGAINNMARAARLCGESVELLETLAKQDCDMLTNQQHCLKIEPALALSRARLNNVLRYMIQSRKLLLPSEVIVGQIIDEVMMAAEGAQPLVRWRGAEVRRHRGHLYILSSLPLLEPADVPPITNFDVEVNLGVSVGALVFKDGCGTAIDQAALQGRPLEVRYRQAKLRCVPAGRPSNLLTHWFQQYRLEPWLRDRQPLLYCGDQLVAAPGLFVSEGYQYCASKGQALWVSWVKPAQ